MTSRCLGARPAPPVRDVAIATNSTRGERRRFASFARPVEEPLLFAACSGCGLAIRQSAADSSSSDHAAACGAVTGIGGADRGQLGGPWSGQRRRFVAPTGSSLVVQNDLPRETSHCQGVMGVERPLRQGEA